MVGADKGARVFQPAINRGQECPRSIVRPFGGPTRRSAPTKDFGLSRSQLAEIEQIIEEHYDELKRAWEEHFPG